MLRQVPIVVKSLTVLKFFRRRLTIGATPVSAVLTANAGKDGPEFGGMRSVGMRIRVVAGLALLSACNTGPMTAVAAQSSIAPLLWRDVSRVQILCLVDTDRGVDSGALHDRLCLAARSIAAAGAPVAVEIITPGDPKVLAADAVTLLIHVSVRPRADGRLFALSVRPYRASDPGGQLFSAAPRAVLVEQGADGTVLIADALNGALAETIPWLAAPTPRKPASN